MFLSFLARNRYIVSTRIWDMNVELRKLRIIEALRSMKDIRKINQIEVLLLPLSSLEERRAMLDTLSGAWTSEEAEDIKKIIEEGCEQIDENEW